MPHSPLLLRCALLPRCVAFLLGALLATELPAAISVTLANPTSQNTNGWVLAHDADDPAPGTDREGVKARAQLAFIGTAGQAPVNWRLIWQLLDDADTTLDLISPTDGSTVTEIIQTYQSPIYSSNQTIPVTFNQTLRPLGQLSRTDAYRVRYRFQGFAAGSWQDYPNAANATRTQSPSRRYLHFTNAVSGDAAQNALVRLDSAGFTRGTIIRSVPGQSQWQVAVEGSLTRFDDFDDAVTTAEIPLTFTYVLRQQGGAAIALVSDTFTQPVNVDSYVAGAPLNPATAVFVIELPVQPVNFEEIDPTLTYTLEISVSTPDGENASIVGDSRRLLALSGELRFGSISTQFTELANNPAPTTAAVCAPPEPCWSTSLAVVNQSGSIPGLAGRSYGDGSSLNVLVFPNGVAIAQGASVALVSAAPDFTELSGVRVLRGPATLSDANGLRLDSLALFLPQGFSLVRGERTRRARGVLEIPNYPVGLDLLPMEEEIAIPGSAVPGAGTLYAQHENFPTRVAVSSLTWSWQNGLFTVNPGALRFERTWEDSLPSNLGRASNDGYFSRVSGSAGGGPIQVFATNGIARLQASLTLTSGVYAPLFPSGAAVSWAGDGLVTIVNSALDPAASYLGGDGAAVVSQNRGCAEIDCIGADPITLTFQKDPGAVWQITPDGGLRAAGTMNAPTTLQWGRQPGAATYTHETSQWTDSRFVAAGFLAQPPMAPDPLTAPAYAAALKAPAMLLTGWSSPSDDARIERPSFEPGAPYQSGEADYPGLNFRVGTDNAVLASSRLGGTAPIGYGLRGFVKVYARQGGISGTHQGVNGGVTELILYGFRANIGPDPQRPDNGGLRLAFLDSENVRSLTGGTLLVPGYSNFNQPFKELTFSCYGGPDQALLDSGPEVKNPLRYWGSEFSPLSMSFVPQTSGASCPSSNAGALVMGARFRLNVLSPDALDATLGFEYDGNLVTPATAAAAGYPADLHSRLTPPASMRIAATGGEHFPLATRGQAYFNNPRPAPLPYPAPPGLPVTPTSGGWLNVIGALDVPFFHDLKVHLHLDPASGGGSPVLMMGGWPADDRSPDNLGWASGAKTFFNDPGFDAASLGYDPASGSVAAYRTPPSGEKRYRPRVQQDWLEVVHLDYSILWDNGRFIPAPNVESETNLLVIKLAHRLLSLSPSTAEVTFGIQYNGLSALNAANLAATGAGSLFGSIAAALPGAEAIPNATRQFDALLSDQIGARIGASIETALAPALDNAVASLRAQDPSFWLTGANLAPIVNTLIAGLESAGAPNLAVTADLRASLAGVDAGIGKVLQLLPAQGANAGSLFGQMVRNLITDHGPPVPIDSVLAVAFGGASPELNRSLPALFDIRSTLEKARGPVQAALEQIDAGTSPVRAAIASSLQQAPILTTGLTQQIRTYLSESAPAGQFFVERDAAAVRARLLSIVRENVAASGFAASIQSTLKNHFSETQRRLRAGFDSFFAETNRLIRDSIKTFVSVPDGPFRKGLGDLSRMADGNSAGNSSFGSFNLQGYAAINGDSLQELRLDGKVVLSAPDSMNFQGGIRILALDSRSPGARCFLAGANPRAEVSLSASAPFPFFGATNATMQAGARFTFNESGLLLGLGGHFGVIGDVQIGGVKLKELKFLFAFGASDNYLGCSARAAFQGYEFAGAFFLGTACGIEPLRLLDPDVADALADAGVNSADTRITGVYIYAEGWMPLNNLIGIPDSCLFSLRAGAGVGPFGFLINGPRGASFALGSKMFFGITADVLCLAHAEANITLVGSLVFPIDELPPERGAQSGSQGLALRLRGRGEFEVEVGPCPFCISFSTTVKFHAQIGGGDSRFGFGH